MKMVDNYITLEGLFEVILYTHVEHTNDKASYVFVTNNTKQHPAKSPMEMFKEETIPNDLNLVSKAIDKYNK